MSIPSFDVTKIAEKDGDVAPVAKSFFDQLIIALQTTIKDQGLIPPRLTAAQIAQLNIAALKGAYVYNTDTDKGMINENGTFRTIATT